MNFKLLILAFFTFFTYFSNSAQSHYADNKNPINDTSQLSKLLKQARKHQFSNPDSFIYLLNILDKGAKKLKSKKHEYLVNFFRGSYFLGQGDYENALTNLTSSLKLAKEVDNTRYINYNHLAISSVYIFLAYYPLAQEHLMTALKNFEKEKDYEGAAGVYLNLTFINTEQKDYELANKNSKKAFEYYSQEKNDLGLARALLNLGEVNYYLKNYKDAIIYSKKALIYTKLSNQPSMDGLIYQNIGNVFLDTNAPDSAMVYFNKSLAATKQWGKSFSFAECKQSIAKAFASQRKYPEAIKMAIESYKIADETQMTQVKANAADLLSKFYSISGNYKSALFYKNIASVINDSLFTKEKYKVQNEVEAIYESQKKEQQIETLSKEKQIEVLKNQQSKYYIFTLLILLIIIAVVAILFIRNNRLKAVHKTIELEQRLLRSQMNPHFIFNAVSSIQEFIMKKEPLEASSYLSNFAKLMRSILNNSATEFITVDEEIETLEHYLKLQKLRFDNKLEYEIIVDDELETSELVIPPMLGQPFIENSIKHGIAKKTTGIGNLTVELYQENNNLMFEIKDNGIGLDASAKSGDNNQQSMATKITQNRINNFKKEYKNEVDFMVKNITNNNKVAGVCVTFKLPKKYLN
jgi:hypothetical protein